MPYFIVNRNAQPISGDNEVHNLITGCAYMPLVENRVDLGSHDNCRGAVTHAMILGYAKANGCFWCANGCHTT